MERDGGGYSSRAVRRDNLAEEEWISEQIKAPRGGEAARVIGSLDTQITP